MKHLLMIYTGEQEENAMLPDEIGQVLEAYGTCTDALIAAGALQAGERLRPVADATSVRVRGGKTEVLNGPYAETREQPETHVLRPTLASRSAHCRGGLVRTCHSRPPGLRYGTAA